MPGGSLCGCSHSVADPCCDSLPRVPCAACMVHAHAQQPALPLAAVRASLAKAQLSPGLGWSLAMDVQLRPAVKQSVATLVGQRQAD